jgi:NAD(P)-dependent dehydrogenase (short-subunit alcohol dehydrogenase family)
LRSAEATRFAGAAQPRAVSDLPRTLTALFLTNAVGPIHLARTFLDLVRDGPGIVAFMTSGLGSVANNTGGGSSSIVPARPR